MGGKIQKLCDSYVSYYVFFWVIGVIMTAISFSVAIAMSAKADVGSIGNRLETQMNDTEWIKQTLSEIKQDIKQIK